MDWVKTTARRDKKHLNFEIRCNLYKRFYGTLCVYVGNHEVWFGKLINPVWPYGGIILLQISVWTLIMIQVIAGFLTLPSHFVFQCCLIVNWMDDLYGIHGASMSVVPKKAVKLNLSLIIPSPFNVYWFHLVRLSVCGQNRTVSALYLQQYLLDPFHICTFYQAIPEGVLYVKFWQISLNL